MECWSNGKDFAFGTDIHISDNTPSLHYSNTPGITERLQ